MKFSLSLDDGSVLRLVVSEVEDNAKDRGREANIEMALLRAYGWHSAESVEKAADGRLVFRYVREDSTLKAYEIAKRTLAGFGIEV